MTISTKQEFMRTFLQPSELMWYNKDKSSKKGYWEQLAVNRHLSYNRANSRPFKIKVVKSVKKSLPLPTLTGRGNQLRAKHINWW